MTKLLLFVTTGDVQETFHTKKDVLKPISKPQMVILIPDESASVIQMIVTILFKRNSVV